MVAPETLIRIPTHPKNTHLSFSVHTRRPHVFIAHRRKKNFPRHSASITTNQSSPVLSEYAYFIHRPDLRTVLFFVYRAQHWSQGVLWGSSENQLVSIDLTPPTLRGWNSFVLSRKLVLSRIEFFRRKVLCRPSATLLVC